jgi:hypothetical protein
VVAVAAADVSLAGLGVLGGRVAPANVAEDLQDDLGGHRAGFEAAPEPIGVDVVSTEQLSCSVVAVVSGPLTVGPTGPEPASAGVWSQRDGAAFVEGHHHAVEGAGLGTLVGGEDPFLLGLVEGIVAALPGAGALRGDPIEASTPA